MMTDTTGLPTVGDAITALSAHDPATPLRVATQPGSPTQHHLVRVGYLPAFAGDALGWPR